jgi:hypothetical protein
MSARKGIYLLLGFNVLYIGALAICAFFIGGLRSPDFATMRSKIVASPSLEDLQPRALYAISAIESADNSMAGLHEVAIRLVWLGIT